MYMSVIRINKDQIEMKNDPSTNEALVHQTLLEALNYPVRKDAQLLYRRDKTGLCVYSKDRLDQDRLLNRNYIIEKVVDLDGIYKNIADGDVLKLYFRAAPSVKKKREGKKNSLRYGLTNKQDRLAWVQRKLQDNGVMVCKDTYDTALILENGWASIKAAHFSKQQNSGQFKCQAYNYVATVKVSSVDKFMELIKNGIGPCKSYGCGLILVGAV